jgi:hypothetical protein
MTRLNVTDARCAALFASGLQQSDVPTGDAIALAVRRTVRRFGVRGCEGRMAQEFGDHPEAAIDRMRWVRQLVREMPTGSPDLAWPDLAWPDLAWPDLAWPDLAWPDLAWPDSQRAA